jgi:hypothetical protein
MNCLDFLDLALELGVQNFGMVLFLRKLLT